MKQFSILLALLTFHMYASAQTNTLGEEETPRDTLYYPVESARLAIVPFKPKMYRSQIDQEIGEHNGLNYQQVRGYFRLGLDNALFLAAKTNYEVLRMHADDPEVNEDLYYFYKVTGYEAREIVVEEPEPETKVGKTVQKMKKKLQKPEEPEGPNTRMESGQIVQQSASSDKFMATRIINENFFEMLNEKYEIGLYLVVNQLDLLHAPGVEWTQYANDDYPRLIRVHYSIMNKELKEIYSGLATRTFSSTENSITSIIEENFPPLAQDMIQKLPVLRVEQSEELLQD